MRLLHAIHSVNPERGGPIEGIKQLTRIHTQMGTSVEVVCLDGPSDPWVREFASPIHAVGPGMGNYGYSPALVPWLKENASRFDVVIVNGLWQYNSYGVWKALRGTGKPYFVFPHGMLDPWFKHTYPLKHLKKWIYWHAAEQRCLRDANAVLFTCEDEKRLARQSFSRYQCREEVVSYGTAAPTGNPELQCELFLKTHPQLRGRHLALFLSRIHEKKGCDILIRSFAAVAALDPLLHLVMAGPDQAGWRAELEAMGARLGVADRIHWPGMVKGDVKWGAFYASEVFVLPSHQENFGIAVVEALACGVPVLISNKVNIWREIEEDGAGFASEDTEEGMLGLWKRWLLTPEEERICMKRRAKACFLKRFEIQRAARGLIETMGRCGVKQL